MRKSSRVQIIFSTQLSLVLGQMKYGCLLSTKTQKFHISASLGQILATLVSILVVSGAISRLVINGSD